MAEDGDQLEENCFLSNEQVEKKQHIRLFSFMRYWKNTMDIVVNVCHSVESITL